MTCIGYISKFNMNVIALIVHCFYSINRMRSLIAKDASNVSKAEPGTNEVKYFVFSSFCPLLPSSDIDVCIHSQYGGSKLLCTASGTSIPLSIRNKRQMRSPVIKVSEVKRRP